MLFVSRIERAAVTEKKIVNMQVFCMKNLKPCTTLKFKNLHNWKLGEIGILRSLKLNKLKRQCY